MATRVRLTRRVGFSAMHTLTQKSLSARENERLFGKCCNLHGHDYFLEVTIEGEIDPQTGLICDRDRFEDVLNFEIAQRYNGSNLNLIFKSTTGEELARHLYGLLKDKLAPMKLIKVRLQETPKNFFCWSES